MKNLKTLFNSIKHIILQQPKFIAVSVITTAFGFYLATGFASIENFIFSIIGGGTAMILSGVCVESEMQSFARFANKPEYEIRKTRYKDPSVRLSFYLICICVLFTVTAVCVSIGSAGAEAGDVEESTGRVATEDVPPAPDYKQREWKQNMFLALLAPSLIGIRLALGEPKKDKS